MMNTNKKQYVSLLDYIDYILFLGPKDPKLASRFLEDLAPEEEEEEEDLNSIFLLPVYP